MIFSFAVSRRIRLGWRYQRGTVCCPRLVEPQHVRFALDATSAYIEYTDFDNGTNGRIILVALASGPVHGTVDRGESGESAARTKYHSHGIPRIASLVCFQSCIWPIGLYRVLDRLSS